MTVTVVRDAGSQIVEIDESLQVNYKSIYLSDACAVFHTSRPTNK